jgi:pyruvate formate lyase activating enzyme
VDLKAADPAGYRLLGGQLGPVLESIASARALGFWVEVVTLVVPGLSDDRGGLRVLGDHLREIDPSIPSHLNGFVPRYRLAHLPATPPHQLLSAAGTAYARGLRFVYVGNVGGAAAGLRHTRCPECHATLVERGEYQTLRLRVADGSCWQCGLPIPGLWG